MRLQSAMDPKTAQETIFRAVRNSATKTSTVTIAAGTPLVLETATASADGAFVRQAVTSTDITNNLYVGNADAALAASLFHDGKLRIPELKEELRLQGVPVRL